MNFEICFVLLNVIGIHSFIIPDELPSLLSIIYSNIPTLKKGTDSRIGWGFRLGDRADFQILTEFGPQQYTQKLANQEDENGSNKRSTLENLANTLYAQRQQDKKQQHAKKHQQDKKPQHQKENATDLKSGSDQWLKNWSKTMEKTEELKPTTQNVPSNAKPGLGIGEIDAKSVIPDDSILEQLENQKQTPTTTRKPLKKSSEYGKPAPANQTLLEILTQDDRLNISADKKDQSPLDDVSLE
ncbi:unnamed protein product [Ceutorhynchus assimilis]|uniref:Uncharacterized protein n=1 Tax=Ceutorhynchus assimilis TaxID=467358 RepID=A0A9N9MSY2_9CUCU|nr:unnamed protein product [Ceutorhynchus assimilis]